jgi:hypothetical protein
MAARPQTIAQIGARRPNTYDEALIRQQGAAKRSEGVNDDGSIPGFEGNLDKSTAGDNWTTIGVQQDGLNLTYAVPILPGDTPDTLLQRFKKTKQHYGAFETDMDAENFMRMKSLKSLSPPATALPEVDY